MRGGGQLRVQPGGGLVARVRSGTEADGPRLAVLGPPALLRAAPRIPPYGPFRGESAAGTTAMKGAQHKEDGGALLILA